MRGAVAPLALDSPPARGASFRDILSRQSSRTTLALTLRFREAHDPLSIGYVIRDLPVQLAIARGELSPTAVIVHWLRALDDGRSAVDTITFDEAARPQGAGWPPGVFAEDTEQAKALLRTRKERGFV